MQPAVTAGLSVLFRDYPERLKGRSVGLITNPTGVDARLQSNVTLFGRHPDLRLAALFSPEHGIWGSAADGFQIASTTDERRRIPIYSLYGETRRPTREMLEGIDALAYDIQDVGARFYTYISTLLLTMTAAAECGVDFLVLDRPNPIRGDRVEGNLLQPAFQSFVGQHPLPIRHGMTVGELARLFKAELNLNLRLEVIPMTGWRRSMWYNETGLPWVPPSPNMPTLDTATLYPGTCLIEGTNLSEGRGTAKPFEWIGAPWIDADAWAGELNALNPPGVRFQPVCFTPTASKHANMLCHGVQAHITDRDRLQPIDVGLHLIATALRAYPNEFAFRQSGERYYFDLLAGTDKLRLELMKGKSPEEIMREWQMETGRFAGRREPYLLYD
jgi:uncharacterized protein YbbC (DUF1343 family)